MSDRTNTSGDTHGLLPAHPRKHAGRARSTLHRCFRASLGLPLVVVACASPRDVRDVRDAPNQRTQRTLATLAGPEPNDAPAAVSAGSEQTPSLAAFFAQPALAKPTVESSRQRQPPATGTTPLPQNLEDDLHDLPAPSGGVGTPSDRIPALASGSVQGTRQLVLAGCVLLLVFALVPCLVLLLRLRRRAMVACQRRPLRLLDGPQPDLSVHLNDAPAMPLQRNTVRQGVLLTVSLGWRVDDEELLHWNEWLGHPAADFSLGIVSHAEVMAGAHAPAAAEEPTVAVPLPVHPADPPEEPQPVSSATATLNLQRFIDAVIGTGLLCVVPLPASAAPVFVPVQHVLGAARADALLAAINDHVGGAPWLRAVVLLACRFELSTMSAQEAYDVAMNIASDAGAALGVSAADWHALRIRLQIAWLERQGRAARLLGLAGMKQEVAVMPCRDALVVQRVWLEALQWGAAQQQGPAAARHYADAAAVCAAIGAVPMQHAEGQRLLAQTLLLRARVEDGGVRQATLRQAEACAEEAFVVSQDPQAALGLAEVGLARAACVRGDEAAALIKQALHYAACARAEPRLELAALQCELALQLAYDDASSAGSSNDVPQQLADRLGNGMRLAAETWVRVIEMRHVRGQFRLACEAAAQAAQQHGAVPRLIPLWERASAAWGAEAQDHGTRCDWQDNVRARQIASLNF